MELSRNRIVLPAVAAALLVLAVLAGMAASGLRSGGKSTSMDVFSSGIGSLKSVLANALYLRIDDYHHLWMYQGHSWTTATDYLPMIWLIVTLKPGFEQAYVDGSYHLAVNLGKPREGLSLLRRGMRNCPRSLALHWEHAVVSWKADLAAAGIRYKEEALWDYLRLVRRQGGDREAPWNESNALVALSDVFNAHESRAHNRTIGRLYDEHADQRAFLRRSLSD